MGIRKMVEESKKKNAERPAPIQRVADSVIDPRLKKVMEEKKIEPLGRPAPSDDTIGCIQDSDLAPINELLEKKEVSTILKLTPEMIKTLPISALTTLVEERRSELKQLKIELIARII